MHGWYKHIPKIVVLLVTVGNGNEPTKIEQDSQPKLQVVASWVLIIPPSNLIKDSDAILKALRNQDLVKAKASLSGCHRFSRKSHSDTINFT